MGRILGIGILLLFFAQSEASIAQQAANELQKSLVENDKPARVVLYDEDPSNPKGKQYVGSVVWHTESVKNTNGKPDDVTVHANIDVPERRFKMTMTFRRNTDNSLPASHTVELTFVLPRDFDKGTVAKVPGILMKSNEQARGTPLAGLAVKVTDGAFLVGLSNVESDRSRNLQLLKERSWFDVPLVYSNQRRAIIAIEKGESGERAFALATTTFPSTAASTFDSRQSQPAASLSDRASIDCIKVATQSTNTVAQILCSGRDGATADWDLNSTLWALNGSGNEAQTKALDQDQQHWRDALNRSCMLPKDSPAFSPQQKQCVLDGLHKRATSIRSRLSGDALAESRLTPEQHAEIQKLLIDRGLLKGRADGEFRGDTRQAIRTFQEAEGSTPTGFLSQDQLSHLRSNHQPPASQKSAQSSKTLTPSELDLVRARLTKLWNVPSGQERPEELIVDIRIHIGRDRRLSAAPEVVSQGSSPRYQAAADAAVLAVLHAQPYDMLRDDTYDQWKDMIVTFDPRQMFNGESEKIASKPAQPDTAFPDPVPKVSGIEQPKPAEPAKTPGEKLAAAQMPVRDRVTDASAVRAAVDKIATLQRDTLGKPESDKLAADKITVIQMDIPAKSEANKSTAAADTSSPPPKRDPNDVVAQVLNYSTFGNDEGGGNDFWYKVSLKDCVYKLYHSDQELQGLQGLLDLTISMEAGLKPRAAELDLDELDPQNIRFRYVGLERGVVTVVQHIDQTITMMPGRLDIDRLQRGWSLIYQKYCNGKKRPF